MCARAGGALRPGRPDPPIRPAGPGRARNTLERVYSLLGRNTSARCCSACSLVPAGHTVLPRTRALVHDKSVLARCLFGFGTSMQSCLVCAPALVDHLALRTERE